MYRFTKGFTLIELLITMVVLAVVLGIALPNFNALAKNNQADATAQSIVDAISYARTEAVKRVARVTLCASKDATTCSGTWKEGFIVFVDSVKSDDVTPPDLTLGVLKVWEAQKTGSDLTVTNEADEAVTFIRFTSLGALAKVGAAPSKVKVDIKVEGCNGANAPRLTIGLTGMVSMQKLACN